MEDKLKNLHEEMDSTVLKGKHFTIKQENQILLSIRNPKQKRQHKMVMPVILTASLFVIIIFSLSNYTWNKIMEHSSNNDVAQSINNRNLNENPEINNGSISSIQKDDISQLNLLLPSYPPQDIKSYEVKHRALDDTVMVTEIGEELTITQSKLDEKIVAEDFLKKIKEIYDKRGTEYSSLIVQEHPSLLAEQDNHLTLTILTNRYELTINYSIDDKDELIKIAESINFKK